MITSPAILSNPGYIYSKPPFQHDEVEQLYKIVPLSA